MREKLSVYKFKKIATESFKNGLRLHFDSILLFKNDSFPSAFQLSVLALEELGKSEWVEHYYYSSITNEGFPDKDFEQKWLYLLYNHPKKQLAFLFRWGVPFEFCDKFMEFVNSGQLDIKKQKATYVGLDRKGKTIDINNRISLPKQIKEYDAKQMISLLNDFLIDCCDMKSFYESRFEIKEKDELLNDSLYEKLNQWNHRSNLRKVPLFRTRMKNQ